jgi:hypothetical protein
VSPETFNRVTKVPVVLPSSISARAAAKKLESAPGAIVDEVLARLATIFE